MTTKELEILPIVKAERDSDIEEVAVSPDKKKQRVHHNGSVNLFYYTYIYLYITYYSIIIVLIIWRLHRHAKILAAVPEYNQNMMRILLKSKYTCYQCVIQCDILLVSGKCVRDCGENENRGVTSEMRSPPASIATDWRPPKSPKTLSPNNPKMNPTPEARDYFIVTQTFITFSRIS